MRAAALKSQTDTPGTQAPEAVGARAARTGTAEVLRLQRTIGNAATATMLARRGKPAEAWESWTTSEKRAVQRELRRMRLYDLTIDGKLGRFSQQGLVEAFGGEEWRALDAATAIARLKKADRPGGGTGRTLRYGELFKDGVFDITFGAGYKEAADPEDEFNARSQTAVLEAKVVELLEARGYKEDAKTAAQLLKAAGRAVDDAGYGRWFVKKDATTYAPPAGASRKIHAVVRLLRNTERGGGSKARAAFMESMTRGDASFYTGHGRYGTGPDFDRNFLQFRIYDKPGGKLEQTLDDYEVLERQLAKHGNPWAVFKKWVASGKLEVDFSNAGNLRLVKKTPHGGEFGGALIQWALEQQKGGSATATGKEGELATGAAKSGRSYRLIAFAGCRTADYESALRATPGYGTKEADVLETTRTVYAGYGAYVFASFIDSVLGQATGQELQKAANKAMRDHEPNFSTDPFVVTGLGDNPRR